jgi:FdhD protein
MESKVFKNVTYIQVDDRGFSPAEGRVNKEATLTININGKLFTSAMILATLEKEFVYGHLFTQGIIRRAADITSLTIKGKTAEVTLANNIKKPVIKKIPSGFTARREDIFNCVRATLKSDIFAETEAVHSAGLFLDGKDTVCIAEDLGRHNALDKVIGRGLLQGIDFSRTLAASTGRQPSEMIYKCLNADIPIIATKGVPTTLAIEIAEKAGITIAGLVRGSIMIIYSHPERIE